jgi:hypothetical protein
MLGLDSNVVKVHALILVVRHASHSINLKVEWNSNTPMTPHGQFPFFIDYL